MSQPTDFAECPVPAKQSTSLVGFVRFVTGVVVVGILVNLASDAVESHFPYAKSTLVYLALLLVVVWLLVILIRYAKAYLLQGRYAVEALILNSRNELLLYRHPHHKCMLPPGGRVGHLEFPNDALQRRLQERLGLNPRAYRFDDLIHNAKGLNNGNLGEIQRFASPFLVQRELHRQRRFVGFHYDFIYVIRLLDDEVVLDSSKYGPVQFVDLPTLQDILSQRRTFPDVVDAYKRVLAVIGGEV